MDWSWSWLLVLPLVYLDKRLTTHSHTSAHVGTWLAGISGYYNYQLTGYDPIKVYDSGFLFSLSFPPLYTYKGL